MWFCRQWVAPRSPQADTARLADAHNAEARDRAGISFRIACRATVRLTP